MVTLFSAPCYPMHQAEGEEPFHNKGSVIHLTSPDYATPDVQHFEAVSPRPPVSACAVRVLSCTCNCFGALFVARTQARVGNRCHVCRVLVDTLLSSSHAYGHQTNMHHHGPW